MDNLELYNKIRTVPLEAQKKIMGGRLKGMTDINPMWRIKTLTEQFGVCGFGWKYTIDDMWIEEGANGEKSAFVRITLYIKMGGEWGDGIPATGGSMFVSNEKTGKYTSDECYKMALTDALSVACKSLGMGADVYFAKDRTKYSIPKNTDQADNALVCSKCKKTITQAERSYSTSKYGTALCRGCQK